MRTPSISACLLLAIALGGCEVAPPQAADTSSSATAREAATHHERTDAVEAKDYRDRAAAAGDAALEADKAHDKQLEDAGG